MLVVLVVAALTVGASSSNLVNVSFYSEALCPFCDQLTEGEMNEAVQKVSIALSDYDAATLTEQRNANDGCRLERFLRFISCHGAMR